MAAGLSRSEEDVAGAVHNRHVGHAVAVEVGDQGRVARREADRARLGESAAPLVQLDRHTVRSGAHDGHVEAAVAVEIARRDDGRHFLTT